MTTERLTAFSDGVIAVIITIMVLELKPPHEADFGALAKLAPLFFAYVLSFLYVAIYWNNHHHFFHIAERVDGAVLWANLHLLFWLSMIPFTTSWVDENLDAAVPTAVYGFVLLMAALAWLIMQTALVRLEGDNAKLRDAVGNDVKGKISVVLYTAGIIAAFLRPWIADALYVAVAAMWFLPDRRVERHIAKSNAQS